MFKAMDRVILTIRPPSVKTPPRQKRGWPQMVLPQWCAELQTVKGYFEGAGPMADDCTVLLPDPNNPEAPKIRVNCQISDITPDLTPEDEAPAVAPAPK